MKSSDTVVVEGLLVAGDWLEADLSAPAIRIVVAANRSLLRASPD
jgi:hypothetical protein